MFKGILLNFSTLDQWNFSTLGIFTVSEKSFYDERTMSAPLRVVSSQSSSSQEFEIAVAGSALARILPARYEARSLTCSKRYSEFYRREYLQIEFDVFQGPAASGDVIARLPCFFRLPHSGRLGRKSKLYRVFQLLGVPLRRDRLSPSALKHKLWLVEVGDVVVSSEKDLSGKQRPLHNLQRYSIVKTILERLA